VLRSLGRLWLGVLLLAVALAPAADWAAKHSVAVDLGDLVVILVSAALLGHAVRWAFGGPALPAPAARRLALVAAVVLALVAPILPLTFAQQVAVLVAGNLAGYYAAMPRPTDPLV
jgi:hypothetical protein